MRRNRIVVTLVSGVAMGAVAAPAAAAPDASTSSIRLSGGKNVSVPICAATRDVMSAGHGANMQAVVRAPKTLKGRRGRKGTKLVVDKCAAGKWERVTTSSLGARKKAKRLTLSTADDAVGDYRVMMVNSRNRPRGGAAHVRVGVGEIVDTPVTFTVRNSNRTPLPCFNAPDNQTYQVKGSLVSPRSRLIGNAPDADANNVALYYHGFGYGEFFWRFKDVPGYDYGLEQARDGHASLTLDRLGYGASGGPADANKICYSSQADIADQLIRKLKGGDYTTGQGGGPQFDKVALVGHSAGAFIAQTAQGTFQSADALAMLGFNNVFFTPLAGSYLANSSAQCFANPKTGSNGSRNNAAFGVSDADFIRGHVHNAEPEVVAALLKRRTTDPCGDVISIPPSFIYNQGAVRTIDVPLLIAAGTNDAFFPPPGADAQAQQIFSPFAAGQTRSVNVKDTGHALTLGRTHEKFRLDMDSWLDTYGY